MEYHSFNMLFFLGHFCIGISLQKGKSHSELSNRLTSQTAASFCCCTLLSAPFTDRHRTGCVLRACVIQRHIELATLSPDACSLHLKRYLLAAQIGLGSKCAKTTYP